MKVRTRFAPSPLHLGEIKTALFAWLFAKQHKGVFMLRIEDTDKSRENAEGIENITESLKWLGLDWDEGPDGDKDRGEFGPYIQSKRLDIYLEQDKMLMEQRKAYADPYTKEELDSFRQQAQMQNKPFLFRNHRPKDFVEWKEGMPIRLKTPLKRYEWQDIARGKLSAGEEALDDYVLIKADGYPTYNFAHIVDDHLMQITHVIRGEEFISSMPKFLATYDVLGWQTPEFVTMPPVLNQEGGKKLSKRHGAQPVLEYRQQGYLKEAIINFMASLGWNDGTDQEIYTLDELISKFRLERLQKTGAHFNPEKLNWMNGEYIRGLDEDSLMEHAKDFWPKEA